MREVYSSNLLEVLRLIRRVIVVCRNGGGGGGPAAQQTGWAKATLARGRGRDRWKRRGWGTGLHAGVDGGDWGIGRVVAWRTGVGQAEAPAAGGGGEPGGGCGGRGSRLGQVEAVMAEGTG